MEIYKSSDNGSKAHSFSFTPSGNQSHMIHSGYPTPYKDYNKLNVEWLGFFSWQFCVFTEPYTRQIVFQTKLLVLDQRQLSTLSKKMKLSSIRSVQPLLDMTSAYHSFNQRSKGNGKMRLACSLAITSALPYCTICDKLNVGRRRWRSRRRRFSSSGAAATRVALLAVFSLALTLQKSSAAAQQQQNMGGRRTAEACLHFAIESFALGLSDEFAPCVQTQTQT